jgi:hypothetical protein
MRKRNYEERIKELEKQLKQRDLLLDHISHKCEQNSKINWNGNPSIGFRQVQELAKTFK